jgi:hypothetical protein
MRLLASAISVRLEKLSIEAISHMEARLSSIQAEVSFQRDILLAPLALLSALSSAGKSEV